MEEVDWLVMHQANERIIDHAVNKMEMPAEKAFKNIAPLRQYVVGLHSHCPQRPV